VPWSSNLAHYVGLQHNGLAEEQLNLLLQYVTQKRLYPQDRPDRQMSAGEPVGVELELFRRKQIPPGGVQYGPPNWVGGLLHHDTLRNLLMNSGPAFREAAPSFGIEEMQKLAAERKLNHCDDCARFPEGSSINIQL
jgi:hypothetical protein